MKKIIIPALICTMLFSSCGDDSTSEKKDTSLVAKAEENAKEADEKHVEEVTATEYGINLWAKNSIYDLPQKVEGRKWLKSISFGRRMEIIGDTTVSKKQSYKVKLSEDSVGWINAYTIAKNAKIAIVTGTPKVYTDPDPLALSDNNLSVGDLIAVYDETVDKYYEFVTKKKESKGYIKGETSISFEEIDLEAGIVFAQSLTPEAKEDQMKKLEAFIEKDEYKTSAFYKKANEKLSELSAPEVPELDDSELEEIEDAIQYEVENAGNAVESVKDVIEEELDF